MKGMTMQSIDALIIGAGPAGTSCALGLIKRGLQVVIIDKSTFPRHKTCGGFIGPENRPLLSGWGIWTKLLEQGACVLKESVITSSRGARTVIPLDGEALGVSRKVIDLLLVEKVKSMGVSVYEGAQLRNIYNNGDGFEVCVDHYGNNTELNLRVKHVIDASGQHTPSINLARVQYGISAMYQGIPEAYKRVMLHCCKGGHVGINPFENNQVNVCYVIDADYFKSEGQDPEAVMTGWVRESYQLHRVMIGALRVSPWKAVQIPVRNSMVHYENGIWRVGNSAAFIDTATGGGISVALQSGQLLAQSITGHDHDPERLKAYTYEYQRHFSGQRRLAGLFGSIAHYPWAADKVIRFLDVNNRFRRSAMNYSRPGYVTQNKFAYAKEVLSEV